MRRRESTCSSRISKANWHLGGEKKSKGRLRKGEKGQEKTSSETLGRALEEHLENTVRWARALSAPGPNGVLYRVYKNAPDVLHFLWKLVKVTWVKQWIRKVRCKAGDVMIPKEEDFSNIYQFSSITPLNVEGKIFFSILKQLLGACGHHRSQSSNSRVLSMPSAHQHVVTPNPVCQEWEEWPPRFFLDLANAFG